METNEVIEVTLKPLEIFSLISSIASLILAVVAIALSILFYIMSTKSSKEIENSSNSIKTNVDRLDQLFNQLYTDTFSLVKDTVNDMRQYYYISNNNDKYSQEEEKEKERSIVEEIVNENLKNLNSDHVDKDEIEDLIYKAINELKQLDKNVELEKFKKKVYAIIQKSGGKISFRDLKDKLSADKDFKFSLLWQSLESLVREELISNPFDYNEDDGKVIFLDKVINLY